MQSSKQTGSVSEFRQLIEKLNASPYMKPECRFNLDRIYCTSNCKKGIPLKFIGFADSILNDMTIVPEHLRYDVMRFPDNMSTVRWINRRIFTELLNDLLNDKITAFKTKIVRLRIASNLAVNNAILLTKEERIEWEQHFKLVFYNRCFVMSMYYSTEVCELPF